MHHEGILELFFQRASDFAPRYRPSIPLTTGEQIAFDAVRKLLANIKSALIGWNSLSFKEIVSEAMSFSLIDFDSTLR